jgi:hypothetical protein
LVVISTIYSVSSNPSERFSEPKDYPEGAS